MSRSKCTVENVKINFALNDTFHFLCSDFVDFYSVAELSTPSQIIELLNDIYGCFDKIVIDHDAHKIETIGNSCKNFIDIQIKYLFVNISTSFCLREIK